MCVTRTRTSASSLLAHNLYSRLFDWGLWSLFLAAVCVCVSCLCFCVCSIWWWTMNVWFVACAFIFHVFSPERQNTRLYKSVCVAHKCFCIFYIHKICVDISHSRNTQFQYSIQYKFDSNIKNQIVRIYLRGVYLFFVLW